MSLAEPQHRPTPTKEEGGSPTLRLIEGPLDVRSVALTGLFVISLVAALRLGRTLVLPIVLALLASFTLAPLVRTLVRARMPRPLAASVIVAGLLAGLAVGVWLLYEPAAKWIRGAPDYLGDIEWRLRSLREPLEQVSRATQAVEKLGGGETKEPVVTVRPPSALDVLADQTGALLGGAAMAVVLLYFLLATGDTFLRKVVELLPRFRDKRRAVQIMRQIEGDVSRYLLTISFVNGILGFVMSAAMYALGMPSPILWGVMAASLNFVPLLGAMAGTAVVAGVAVLTFDELSRALVVPFGYALITSLEGMVVTPAILGRSLTLSPVIVFVGIFAGGWLWGVPGALVAVPVMVAVKIFFDRIEGLRALGHLMGR